MGYFRDLVIKSIVAFSFLSLLITNLGESQPPYYEDTQAVLWKRPWGEELRPPANSQVSEASWERILQPQLNLQMAAAQGSLLTALMKP